MGVGFIILAHQALGRVAQVAGYWAGEGHPVAIHVDARTPAAEYLELQEALSGWSNIRFAERRACDWGKFSIVSATQDCAEIMLAEFPDVTHVFLASGSCLPLRPVEELDAFLAARPGTDFIESVTTEEVTWTVGGLDLERFTLRFPFSWKKHRKLFDLYVELQRKLKIRREIPEGVEPHMGSQWWCLTRETLAAILGDPNRQAYDRYFQKVWIPDESYFQSLVRKHTRAIESRSLTLARFDFQGKPHMFYDDHQWLLQRSECFVARKIWPQADGLYDYFLGKGLTEPRRVQPSARKLEKVFQLANERRITGREGLVMQSRFPTHHLWMLKKTCAPYSVFHGFSDLFLNFESWLEKRTGTRVHGHLFCKSEVRFSGRLDSYNGCLSNSAKLRDYNPEAFLGNLIWATQGEHQSFQFGPADRQAIRRFLTDDPNANINVITGAWAIPLLHSPHDFRRIRRIAARHQAIESQFVSALKDRHCRARVQIWTLAEFLEEPMQFLQTILDERDPGNSRRLTEAPIMADLSAFGRFVQKLKNEGMNPHSVGDFTIEEQPAEKRAPVQPYVVR